MALQEVEFMQPWCRRLEKFLEDTRSEVKVWRWGPDNKAAIQFSVASPSFLLMPVEERKADLKVLREGISLFTALAWIDVEASAGLLGTLACKCEEVYWAHKSGGPLLPACVDLKLSQWRAVPEDVAWVNEVIGSMCCRLDPQNTSSEFREAWAEIERLVGASRNISTRSLMGLKIPVCLVIDEFGDDGPGGAVLAQTWEVIERVMDKNQISWGWASSKPEKPLCSSLRSRRDCFTSFTVDSISAQHLSPKDFYYLDTIRTTFVDIVGEMAGRVWFSDVTFPLLLVKKEATAVGRFGRMISEILRTNSCSSRVQQDQYATNTLGVRCTTTRQFSAFCAALVVSQSCQSIHIFPFDSETDSTRAKAWQWLAYGCFSKRARPRSAVRKIELTGADLTREDADAMAKNITSETPEHELLSSDAQIGEAAPNDGEYHVDGSSVVRVYGAESLLFESSEVLQQRLTCGIRLVQDDGASEWVDALVPGIGLCQLQRTSLQRCHSRNLDNRPNPLQLELETYRSCDGVPRLLELVGPTLQSLRLTSYYRSTELFDVSLMFSSCPNLEELTLQKRVVSAEVFVRCCEDSKYRLRRLQVIFDDYRVVARALKDESLQLTKHLRWWYCYRFRLELEPVAPLLEMLDVNRSLRWLTVDTPKTNENPSAKLLLGYNGQQLDVVGDNMSTNCKLAFLSVFDSREGPHAFKKRSAQTPLRLPDVDSLSRIFQFATDRAVRSVKIIHP